MPAYAFSAITGMILSRLENNSALYPTPDVEQDANDAIGAIQLRFGPVSATVTISGGTVIGKHLYAVPSGIIYPSSVTVDGLAMGKTSLRGMGLRNPNWLTESDDSGVQVQTWVPIDLQTFALYPASSTAGRVIQVTGPADLSALTGAAALNIDDKYVEMIVDLASHTLPIVEGGQIFAQASGLYQNYIRRGKADERWQTMKWPQYFVKSKSRETQEEVASA